MYKKLDLVLCDNALLFVRLRTWCWRSQCRRLYWTACWLLVKANTRLIPSVAFWYGTSVESTPANCPILGVLWVCFSFFFFSLYLNIINKNMNQNQHIWHQNNMIIRKLQFSRTPHIPPQRTVNSRITGHLSEYLCAYSLQAQSLSQLEKWLIILRALTCHNISVLFWLFSHSKPLILTFCFTVVFH